MAALGEDDLADVQDALHETDSKWVAIGIQLRLPIDKLNKIESQNRDNHEVCNRQMQIAWLKTGKASWEALVAALRKKSIGLDNVAKNIEDTYIHKSPVPNCDHLSTGIKLSCTSYID